MVKKAVSDERSSEAKEESPEVIGTYFKVLRDRIPKDYKVLIGFSGYGNVGFLAINHLIEQLDLETVGMWGNTIWYYKGRLESLVTLYAHHESKTLILASRYPMHVTRIPHEEWEELALEVLSWNCKAYYIIAGLREETRSPGSTNWVAYAPTAEFTKKFGITPSMEEKLTMIGPLATFLSYGTSLNQRVLGLLIYCNFDEDPEAALLSLSEIEKFTEIQVPNKEKLLYFDFRFLEGLIRGPSNSGIQDIIQTFSDMDPDDIDILTGQLLDEDEDDDDDFEDEDDYFDYENLK